jgi:TRAP-type C4-dicarboxylate transport system substrate-binding protein
MKRKLKTLCIPLAICLVLTALAGCGNNQDQDERVFHFDVAFSGPAVNFGGIHESLDRIQERSNGRITMTYYYSWQLSSLPTIIDDIRTGIVSLGLIPWGAHISAFPHATLIDVPMNGFPSSHAAGEILDELIAEFPVITEDFERAGIVYYTNFPLLPYYLWTGGVDPVRVPSDLAGLRIAANNTVLQSFISDNGGAAVAMAASEWAVAMNTGVIDGGIMHINTARGFGFLDFTDAATVIDGGFEISVTVLGINPQLWASMPADLQQLFDDEAENIRISQGNYNYTLSAANWEWFTGEHGAEVVFLSGADSRVWNDSIAEIGVIDNYLDDMERLGASQIKEVYAAILEKVAARAAA